MLATLARAAAGDDPLQQIGPTMEGTPFDLAAVGHLVQQTGAELLLVEWQPAVAGGDELAREVLAEPPCDVLLIRPGALEDLRKVVVAVGSGPNAPIMAGLAQRFAQALGVKASLLHRVETDDEVGPGRRLCKRIAPEVPAEIVVGRDLTNLLAETAATNGFVAVGASEHIAVDRIAARTGAAQLARRGAATVIVARTHRAATTA